VGEAFRSHPTRRDLTKDLPDPEIGVEYPYVAFTHCGLEVLHIDGDLWVPVGGSVARDGSQTFDYSIDAGTVVLTDPDHGTYTSSYGVEVPIERRRESAPPSDEGFCI
jgi:hypothetical protein